MHHVQYYIKTTCGKDIEPIASYEKALSKYEPFYVFQYINDFREDGNLELQ